MYTRKSVSALLLALVILLSTLVPAVAQEPFPPIIPLPDGFQPEGIAVGRGTTFYVGSIPTGAIFRGDLVTGQGEVWVPEQEGRAAIGLHLDKRTNYLFVSGGPTGAAYVYDGETGEPLAEYQLSPPMDVFINDVYVTRNGAYFTNSSQPVLNRVPLNPNGGLIDGAVVETIELSGDYTHAEGFNLNGITATPSGKWLIAVQSNLGRLYRVDPSSGEATQIDLGGASVEFGDGILLHGLTLYVVQNQLNQIEVIKLDPQLTSGQLIGTIQDENFDVPTTIARFGPFLYAVNARFGTTPTPDTEYNIVQVPKQP